MLVWSVLALAVVAMARQLAIQLENAGLTDTLRAKLAELERSEDRFRVVFDESNDVICLLDGEGCFIEASAAMERMFSWPSEQIRGRSIFELVHPDEVTALLAAFADFLRWGSKRRHVPSPRRAGRVPLDRGGRRRPSRASFSARDCRQPARHR